MRIHVSLPVRDLEHSIGFYQKLFGRPVSKREPGYANFRLDEPPIHLALVQELDEPDADRTGASHYGIEVASREELARWRSRLEEAGLVGREENETCCYAVADKVWVSDPDGREWEVWVRLADASTMRSSTTTCCAPEAEAVDAAGSAKRSAAAPAPEAKTSCC
jgi:catechol-2,3-dioxygenase